MHITREVEPFLARHSVLADVGFANWPYFLYALYTALVLNEEYLGCFLGLSKENTIVYLLAK